MQMLSESFEKLLLKAGGGESGLWDEIAGAGFLDLLAPEQEGGAGLSMSDAFPVAFLLGSAGVDLPVVETMIARALLGQAAPAGKILLHGQTGWPAAIQAEAAILVGREQAGWAGQTLIIEESADRIMALAAGCMAARMSGAMQAITTMTIDFALIRKQFGQPVARFQAIQQQIATMAEETLASAMASSRCFTGQLGGFTDVWAAVAKSRSCCAADVVAGVGHAVHGAIGVSEEHALGGHTRRLRRWRDAYGGQSFWEERLGASMLADSASFHDFLQAHTQQ